MKKIKSDVRGPSARLAHHEQTAKPRFASFIALTIAGMVASLLFLAARTEVPQVVRAPGIIVPFGNYSQIESMDGGIVETVYVADGDTVKAGETLVRLRNPDLRRDAQTLRGDKSATEHRIANVLATLTALRDKTVVDQQTWHDLQSEGLMQAAARLQIFAESQRIQLASIEQQSRTIEILIGARDFADSRALKQRELLAQTRGLSDRGLIRIKELQEGENLADSLQAAASDAAVRLAQAEEAVMIAEAGRQAEWLALQEEYLIEKVALENDLAQITAGLDIINEKLARLTISAPDSGVIQAVSFPTAGEIIEPGETIFELLPSSQSLIVEARIPNIEIGHISANQPVAVTFDSFDVRRYGKVEGEVAAFSPVPLLDEQTGAQFFRASIVLNRATVGAGVFERPLAAGLTVSAEMVTGEQTLLSYFLKPIEHTLDRAFSER